MNKLRASGVMGAILAFAELARPSPALGATFDIQLSLPQGVEARHVVLGASGALSINPGSSIAPNPRTAIVNSSTISPTLVTFSALGNLYTRAPTVLTGATVQGDARSESTILLRLFTTVTGVVRPRVSLGFSPQVQASADFPVTTEGPVSVAGGTTVILAPGRYGSVRVDPSSTLKLQRGRYYFDSFLVARLGRLDFDDTQGPIEIYVLGEIRFEGIATTATGRAGRIFVAGVGSAPTSILAPFLGTVMAPNSDLVLQVASGELRGAFFGRNVTVSARIVHVPPDLLDFPLVASPLNPAAVTPIPEYKPGHYECAPGLILGAPTTAPNGDAAYVGVTYPTGPVDPAPGPMCRIAIRFCDENDQEVPAPTEADLNAPVAQSTTCPPLGGPPAAACTIDPATVSGPCVSDADCASGQVCGAVCTRAGATTKGVIPWRRR